MFGRLRHSGGRGSKRRFPETVSSRGRSAGRRGLPSLGALDRVRRDSVPSHSRPGAAQGLLFPVHRHPTGIPGKVNNRRAREVFAGVSPGQIVVFDKAHVDFERIRDLHQREVWWVSRAKETMAYKVKKTLTKGAKGLLKEQLIVLQSPKHEGMWLRRVEAYGEIDGEERLMVFIPNNLSWSPRSVCELHQRRWDMEVSGTWRCFSSRSNRP